MPVGRSIAEPLANFGLATRPQRRRCVDELLTNVGLDPDHANRYPHMFSGGQRQRIAIARALAPEPSRVVCDEPLSSLDVSIQADILALLGDLQTQLGLGYLFVSHDLAVLHAFADPIVVMYLGEIVEVADADELVTHPAIPTLSLHPPTRCG
jgi:ABC-type oligopeptide transport system ATPase subunit